MASSTGLNADILGAATDRPAALDDRALLGHPRGLGLLFLVEMWERFSYYGMRALLVLYMVHVLKWNDARADSLYGTYTSLAFLTPILGGWLADRWIGTRRSLVIGGLIIATGHFVLAFDTLTTFYLGLGLVVIGTGFFKPNVSTMVGQLYRPGDQRRDSGFTIFYMGINLGALLAPLVTGYLAQSDAFRATLTGWGISPERSWSYGFAAAGVGMVLGLILYVWFRDRYLPDIGLRAAPAAAPTADGITRSTAQISSHGPLTRAEWRRIAALFMMFFFVAFFWVVYEQAGSSLNLFADRYTNLRVGNSLIPSSWFQSVQPLFVVALAPVFAFLWRRLRDRGREPSTQMKMALGLAVLGAGCVFLVIAGRTVDACLSQHAASSCAVASPVWLSSFYLFSVFGELCVSPVGLSYVTKVAPARYVAFLMGAWFLTNASGLKIAGYIASLAARLPSQAEFFVLLLGIAVVSAVLLILCVPFLKRLTGDEVT